MRPRAVMLGSIVHSPRGFARRHGCLSTTAVLEVGSGYGVRQPDRQVWHVAFSSLREGASRARARGSEVKGRPGEEFHCLLHRSPGPGFSRSATTFVIGRPCQMSRMSCKATIPPYSLDVMARQAKRLSKDQAQLSVVQAAVLRAPFDVSDARRSSLMKVP